MAIAPVRAAATPCSRIAARRIISCSSCERGSSGRRSDIVLRHREGRRHAGLSETEICRAWKGPVSRSFRSGNSNEIGRCRNHPGESVEIPFSEITDIEVEGISVHRNQLDARAVAADPRVRKRKSSVRTVTNLHPDRIPRRSRIAGKRSMRALHVFDPQPPDAVEERLPGAAFHRRFLIRAARDRLRVRHRACERRCNQRQAHRKGEKRTVICSRSCARLCHKFRSKGEPTRLCVQVSAIETVPLELKDRASILVSRRSGRLHGAVH